jgi:hypothetical protein
MKTAVLFVTGLVGAQAFLAPNAPVPAATRMEAAKSGKAGAAKAAKPQTANNYLKEIEPGVGPLGKWYVREDPSLSTALPWVTRPEIGDGSLVGDFGFDPFGLSKIFDVNWLRNAELKHGRLAMLATLGMVTPELVQAPSGFQGFQFAPEFSELNAIKALSAVPTLGLSQILLVISFVEVATFAKVYNERFTFEDNLTPLERQKVVQGRFEDLSGAAKTQGKAGINPFGSAVDVGFQDPEAFTPGDLGFDPLGFADNGINPDYALAEIKHARLAMLGAAGMLIQEFLQPKGILTQTAEWAAAQ